ncbi:hypothetical protein QR97_03670 [Streptomyces sp. PBH53]|uniref:hypothetical protein n=1 Tax=Streptomyces sp. PBH53 TaxID=1577075 RepID=UPI0006551161|nr:hypothetical protein [Streptomyces sp. PBH53]AKN75110.1 hypothetical protein QR97_03670 [Streptomyces sp. PBH53]
MSAYSSDLDLKVTDATGTGVEVDVATNLLNGIVRLSVLWTQEIYLSPDDAERVAESLQRAAEHGRRIAEASSPKPGLGTSSGE